MALQGGNTGYIVSRHKDDEDDEDMIILRYPSSHPHVDGKQYCSGEISDFWRLWAAFIGVYTSPRVSQN